ncbi:hypothetical protein [Escherichia albertii]|uniref:hypothetical protein n=1 Tax=Escherichia albertii TaxID=208962 RepID=UPI0007437B7E|nr:hypothetical protein [Escherichia albertii]
MRSECIKAVSKAAGRTLNQAEIKGIEERITRNMRALARDDRMAWQSKSEATRLTEAAKAASDELVAEAKLKKRRVALQIVAHDIINQHITGYRGKDGAIGALNRVLAFSADGKSNFFSVETRGKATRDQALAQLQDLFDASDPKIFGLFENKQGVRDIVFEIFGQDTGNAAAKKGAKAWLDTAESLRSRFNDADGDVGKLEDWNLPQHHSQNKVAKAGEAKWVSDIAGKLNRSKYVNPDGSLMNDVELQAFLTEAYKTISTGGVNKIKPGTVAGGGARANRGNESRQIHFKDAQSYLGYQQAYGERNFWRVIEGHVSGVSQDIALVETFGPNPDHTFKYFLDKTYKETVEVTPTDAGKIEKSRINTENLYDFVAGKTLPVANRHIAETADTLRNLLVASKLGSAVITSLTDWGMMGITARVNNLPMLKLARNMISTLNPANKADLRMARRAGLAMESLLGSVNRWGGDNLGQSWSSKMASTVIRASGLTALSDAGKRAYGVTMMSAIGQLTKDHAAMSALDPVDNRMLLSKGITDRDWATWKLAQQEDWGNGNNTMLTPESIMRIPDAKLQSLGVSERIRSEAARKLLGVVLEEVDMAVVTPGIRDRARLMDNIQRGTAKGELVRSFFLFKSFPIAMVARHWSRGFSMPTAGGKAAYIASTIAATTVLGAISMQLNNVISGRNPQDMSEGRFWLAAMLKGGALGLYGDFLFSDQTQAGRGIIASLMGPMVGIGEETIGLTQGNLLEAMQGEDMDFGAEALKLFKGVTPFTNLWYTKAATDHLIFNKLQEYFSPGYLQKMESRSQSKYGSTYWWRANDVLPEQAPDLGAAWNP